jgi:hypothetical protein
MEGGGGKLATRDDLMRAAASAACPRTAIIWCRSSR